MRRVKPITTPSKARNCNPVNKQWQTTTLERPRTKEQARLLDREGPFHKISHTKIDSQNTMWGALKADFSEFVSVSGNCVLLDGQVPGLGVGWQ